MNKYDVYSVENLIPLEDENYLLFIRDAIKNSTKRVWVCMFLIDCYPNDDEDLAVRNILKLLAKKKKFNVDVKIITEFSRQTFSIHNSNKLAYLLTKYYGLDCRFYIGNKRSEHSKYLIIDDNLCIIGSHNFTPGALQKHKESSIAVFSKNLNIRLSQHFLSDWESSRKKMEKKVEKTSIRQHEGGIA